MQAWRPTHWDPGVYSIVRFDLKRRGSDTIIVLDHTGFPEGDYDSLNTRWKPRYWAPLFLADGREQAADFVALINHYRDEASIPVLSHNNRLRIYSNLHEEFRHKYYDGVFAWRNLACAKLGREDCETAATEAYSRQSRGDVNPKGVPGSPEDEFLDATPGDLEVIRKELGDLLSKLAALPHH